MPVHLECIENIAIIRFDNPPANSLSAIVLKELRDKVKELQSKIAAGKVRAVVITGTGNKFFIAGADISRFPELNAISGYELAREGQTTFEELAYLPCIVIAAINGYALGGGMEIAMACDVRLASANAQLGQPEINLGLIPGYGGTQRLIRLIGLGKAKELIFTGKTITSEEALSIGLVDHVVPEGKVLDEALKMAKLVADKAPLALQLAKEAINKGIDLTLERGLRIEAELFARLCTTEDQKEGAKAFLEKRKPQFKGI